MAVSYTARDILYALSSVGIRRGDSLFLHSNIGFFGKLDGATTQREYAGAFLATLREAVGENGNICLPTFTYSFCKGEFFDPAVTSAAPMGILAEHARTSPGAVRSHDANFSIAVIGKDADMLTCAAPDHSFGPDSFWERFLHLDGKVCNFNYDAGSTMLHYFEKLYRVPYRFDKPFSGKLIVDGQTQDRTFIHFVRHLDRSEWDTSMSKFHEAAEEAGILSKAALGRGGIVALNTTDMAKLISERLDRTPYFFTVGG
jgi:aminoglycoside 3-N-acetyltransferase